MATFPPPPPRAPLPNTVGYSQQRDLGRNAQLGGEGRGSSLGPAPAAPSPSPPSPYAKKNLGKNRSNFSLFLYKRIGLN